LICGGEVVAGVGYLCGIGSVGFKVDRRRVRSGGEGFVIFVVLCCYPTRKVFYCDAVSYLLCADVKAVVVHIFEGLVLCGLGVELCFVVPAGFAERGVVLGGAWERRI